MAPDVVAAVAGAVAAEVRLLVPAVEEEDAAAVAVPVRVPAIAALLAVFAAVMAAMLAGTGLVLSLVADVAVESEELVLVVTS